MHGEGRFFRYALRAPLQKRPSFTALGRKSIKAMIELQPEHKPFYFVSAAMLGVEVLYFLNAVNDPGTGLASYWAFIALCISLPMLVAACLGLMSGYLKPAKNLLLAGLLSGLLWFMLAVAAISKVACVVAVAVSAISYKMLQYHHRDVKAERVSAQQGAQADGPASGGPAA